MRLRSCILSSLLFIFAPSLAFPQAGDLQRCVWSCLYGPGKGNPASAAYNRCVEQRCAEKPAAKSPSTSAQNARDAWVTGRDGKGVNYAGVDGRRPGTGLYYFCGRGQKFLRVIGIDGGERGMIIDVDGRQFPLQFEPNAKNQPESRQSQHAPVIKALQKGNRVKVLSYELGAIVDATLRGSSKALSRIISTC